MVPNNPQPSGRVCIVGGGLVGLAGSILLRRQGFDITVFERNATLETAGYGIQLHPNGMRVLQDMGVYDKLMLKATKGRSIILRAYDTGRVMNVQDLSGLETKYGAPVLTFQRADLLGCLHETAVNEGIQIHLGAGVEASGIDLEHGRVITSGSYLDGTSDSYDIEADLFIGADGIGSAVRTAMIGAETDINPHGQVVDRMAVSKSAVYAVPSLRHLIDDANICLWMGPGGHVVVYTLHDTMYIAYIQPWSTNSRDAFFGPQKVDLSELRAALLGWDPQVHELVSLSLNGQRERRLLFEPPSHDFSWVAGEGKFCLVGEAAHPILPYLSQGASQGLESIAVLAHLLGKANSSEESLYTSLYTSRCERNESGMWAERVERAAGSGNLLMVTRGTSETRSF
ncbi:FAD binding domain-containing protein [Astrocystis sublimbata]|nr:FAD binding domain-containing protein [Astrocystis sublimbata]